MLPLEHENNQPTAPDDEDMALYEKRASRSV